MWNCHTVLVFQGWMHVFCCLWWKLLPERLLRFHLNQNYYIDVFHDAMPDNYNDIYNLLFTSGCTCMFPQRYLSSRGEHHYYLPWSLFRPSDDSSRSLFRSHQVFLLFGEPCLLFWVRLIIWLFLLEFISPLLQVNFLELLYLLDFDYPPAIGHRWLDFPERSLQV